MAFAAVVSFTSCSDEMNLPNGPWTAHADSPEKGRTDGAGDTGGTGDAGDTGGTKDEGISYKEFNVKGVAFKMVLVNAGTFSMGGNGAKRTVTLTKDYYIGETEVTQALWKAVTGHTPTPDNINIWRTSQGLGDNYPAYFVSWNDAQDFITKLNQLTSLRFRLPTEAEWEFAARGGNRSKNYTFCGSNDMDEVGWYDENDYNLGYNNANYGSHAAKLKLPNELGIYDMSGNVWEWCYDVHSTLDTTPTTDPKGPTATTTYDLRVTRGGAWISSYVSCCVSSRKANPPMERDYINGLRLALSK